MFFDEIKPKMRIILNVSNGDELQARFMSKVMLCDKESIMAIPFRHKGKRINFSGKQVKIHMEVRDDSGILWTFKNIKVFPVKKNGLVFHKIVSPMKNGIENRREGRRFYVWSQAMFDIEGVESQFFAQLKDVGVSGASFAVELKREIAIKEGSKYSCSFKNKDGLEIEISGLVIRKEIMDKYVVYGCKIEEPSAEYLAYVKYQERKNTIVDVDF